MKINNKIYIIILSFYVISTSGCNLFSKDENPPTSSNAITTGTASDETQNIETTTNNYQTTNITTDTSYQTTNITIDSTLIDTTITINIEGKWEGTYKDIECTDTSYILKNGIIEFNIHLARIGYWKETLSGVYQADGSIDNIILTGNLITQTETESGTYDINGKNINLTIIRKFTAIISNGVMKGIRDSTVNGTYTDPPYGNYYSYWKMDFTLTR